MSTHQVIGTHDFPESWEIIQNTSHLMEEYHRTAIDKRSAKFTEVVTERLKAGDPFLVVGRATKSIYRVVDGLLIEEPLPMPTE